MICCERDDIWYVSGEAYLDNLWDFDIIFKSPGISPFQEKLLPYRDKFVSQTQVFFENYKGKTIWITWTKGKSTISTLLHTCLQSAWYDVKLVWNIWKPVLDEIDFSGKEHDYVIYELSSYMLQDFSPNLDIWYLNNIYPCHLDWHYDSFSIYRDAKVNILRHAKHRFIHGDFSWDSEVQRMKDEKIFFDSKGIYSYDSKGFYKKQGLIYDGKVGLEGEHNKKNICGIIWVLDRIISDDTRLKTVLEGCLPWFTWLPHRIEDIGTYEGIRFINDAIATTPESTMAAIETFGQTLETLFLGGEDSGFDFSKIREKILDSNIQNIIAFPDTSQLIFPEIELRDYDVAFELEIEWKLLQCIKTRDMATAVDFAYRVTLPGKTAMLSCAAPSFSLWKSYTQKAEQFIKEVRKY